MCELGFLAWSSFSRAAWKEKVKDAESHFTQGSSEASHVSESG